MKRYYLVIIIWTIGSLSMYGQEDVKINKISIFTDGNSFVEKTVRFTPEDNRYILKEKLVPKARFGTLLITDKDNSIISIKSYVDTIQTPNLISKVKISSYVDILKANLNKKVIITTEGQIREGEVIEIVYQTYGNTPSHIIFKEESNYDLIKTNDIVNLSFPSKPIIPVTERVENDRYSNEEEQDLKLNVLLEFDDSDEKEISMKYLQRGMSWTPFYYLELDDNRNIAKLSLKAEVINDSEEIWNSDLELFIGEPNFRYSGYLTDLVDFKNLLNPLYDAGYNRRNTNPLAAGYLIDATGFGSGNYNKNENQSPKNYQDFYIYKLKNESLKKNSRAHYNLFEKELKYRHVYQCDLLNINHQKNSQKKEDNKVYHSLKFVNETRNLLGEGPVTIIDNTDKEYIPLAQSKLDYTPSKATGLIKITETPEIEIVQKEEVIDVDEERMNFWGRSYRKARIRVIVKIKNYKEEKIELILRQEVFGEVEENPSFKLLEKKEKHYLPNAINQLEWNLQLEPSEGKEIIYEYEYFRQ